MNRHKPFLFVWVQIGKRFDPGNSFLTGNEIRNLLFKFRDYLTQCVAFVVSVDLDPFKVSDPRRHTSRRTFGYINDAGESGNASRVGSARDG